MKNCARKKFLGGLHAITGNEVKSSRWIGMALKPKRRHITRIIPAGSDT
jgi:hypothetical protein